MIATWCQRSEPPAFTHEERVNLTYLYEEWAHPYFISIDAHVGLLSVVPARWRRSRRTTGRGRPPQLEAPGCGSRGIPSCSRDPKSGTRR